MLVNKDTKIYFQNTEIKKIYLGSNLIWQRQTMDESTLAIINYANSKGYALPSNLTALDNFIKKIKSISNGNFWLTRDTLFIRPLLGNSTTHNGLRKINLRNPTNQEQVFYGGLTLNSYGGLQGNGVDAYVDLVTPVNAYDNYKQNDAGIIAVKTTSSNYSLSARNASATTTLLSHTATAPTRINSSVFNVTTDLSGLGAIGITRNNSTTQRVMFKSTKIDQTVASTALYSASFRLFSIAGTVFTNDDNLLLITGASFTDDEYDLAIQYFNEYLTEIGMTPIP